jgi:hypothetical protein
MSGERKKAGERRKTWWDRRPHRAGGDVIIGNIGDAAHGVVIGKDITQQIHDVVGEPRPDDRAIAEEASSRRSAEGPRSEPPRADARTEPPSADPLVAPRAADPVGEHRRSGPAMPRPLRVFLCHSSGDKAAVRELHRRLHADGVEPWLDEEQLLPGQDWDREIRSAVRASDAVLVCVSAASSSKTGYLQKEVRVVLDAADEQPEGTIFVIPARLEECEVPERLRRWQRVDLFQERGYGRLLGALAGRASASGLVPPRPPNG